jgi:hypothetical protein
VPVRRLPLILVLGAAVGALAPARSAAQVFYMGPGQRTDGSPSDREAQNGVFAHRRKAGGLTPTVILGEVQPAPARVPGVRPEDVAALYVTRAVPYTTDPPPRNHPIDAPARKDSGG